MILRIFSLYLIVLIFALSKSKINRNFTYPKSFKRTQIINNTITLKITNNTNINNKRILTNGYPIYNFSIITDCLSGKFTTSEIISNDCLNCPDGYDCSKNGTYWPSIIKEGYYKTISEACPKGTFSFMKGIKDSSLCIICPSGTICEKKGINTLEDIKNCEEGYICRDGTGFYQREKCPKGFFCKKGTNPLNKYENKCPEGYICSDGIGDTNKFGVLCPINYYCPLGSGYIIIEENGNFIDEYDLVPKCPFGTSTLGYDGMKSLIECKINEDFFIFLNFENYNLRRLNIIENDYNISNNNNYFVNKKRYLNESDNTFDDNERESGLEIEKMDDKIKSYYIYLKNVDWIEIYLSKYDSNIILDYELNTLRKPLLSFSPINLTSSYPPIKEEELFVPELTEFFKIYKYYFKIEKNSYALITIDLRHIISLSNDIFFIYGIDWDITFEKVLSIENNIYQILDIPTTFISKENDKSNAHEFNLFSYEDMILSFNINIYNGLYYTYISYFKDIATLIVVNPQRAELYTNKFFGIILLKENIDTISLPINIPIKNISYNSDTNLNIKDKVLKNIISYNSLSNNILIKNEIKEGLNKFTERNYYWDISTSIGMTHIPFISNCKGYGKYIHLWSLLEQNSQCELKSENETIFIQDFSFGLQAIGDNCNISLDCIYDENVTNLTNDKFWYQATNGFTLFKITKNPITLEMLDNPDDLELVDVKVENNLENDEIPKTITLSINYFQVSKTLKKIIEAKIIFSEPWNKSEIQKLNDSVNYKFNVIFNPYSHTELMIAFALSSNFNIVLYLVVGFATTIIVSIFFLINRQLSRIKPLPTFKIRTFFPLILPPVITGFFISVIPIFLEIIICHFIFVGKFIFNKFKIFKLTNYKGEDCESIFDLIGYIGENDLETIRKGRFGTSFLILGIFLSYYHTQLVVPNVPIKETKSYDNNRFDFINWKKIFVYYVDFLLSILNVYYTILSFCDLWSKHIWFFIYSYKIIGIIVENYFEEMFQEQLLIAGFGCLFNLIQNMITFGASDLIDFLLSSMIEQISLIIEKVYIETFTNYLKEHMNEYKKAIKRYIRKLIKYDVEFEAKENGNNEDYDNEVIYLEEESEISENNESFISGKKKSKKDKNQDEDEYNSISESSEKKIEQKEIEIEEYIDRYKGFASDLLGYFYNIFFYFILWITREENYILDNYNISNDNFIYFYYFSIVSIPFSIINDIIVHNILEFYKNIQMHDFLDYFNYRYYIRTENWALDQQEINLNLDPASVKMFKIGFSSQYYYLKTIYISGLLFIVIGVVTLILNEINPFLDIATPFIIIFVYITLKLILTLSSFSIHIFKVWEIEKGENTAINNKNEKLLNNINNIIKNRIKPQYFEKEKWEKIKFIKEQEQIIEENIKTERLILDLTKKQFIEENRQWIKDEISKIITPRTLLKNKKKLIEILGKQYSNIVKTNINFLPVKFYSSNNSSIDENEKDNNYDNLSLPGRKQKFLLKIKNKNIFKDILRIWKNRTKLNKKLMKIIRLNIIEMKKKKCDICGIGKTLNVVYEGNLVNTFINFLKITNQTIDNFKEIDFKIFFKKNESNNIKTKCINCS